MRYFGSTKNLVKVGNSIYVSLGREARRMNKKLGDKIGVAVFEPEMIDEAEGLLGEDHRGRYFISVHNDSDIIEIDIVYGRSARSIRKEDGPCLSVVGPFDSLRSCEEFRRMVIENPPEPFDKAYQDAYHIYIMG